MITINIKRPERERDKNGSNRNGMRKLEKVGGHYENKYRRMIYMKNLVKKRDENSRF